MDISDVFGFFQSQTLVNTLFKTATVIVAFLYVLFSIVIAKQVKIMDKSLEADFNQFIFFVCSLQTTVALILLIFSIFLI